MNDFDNLDQQSMKTMRGDDVDTTMGQIDQYEVIRKIGSVEFSELYLVRDSVSNVLYILKTLHPILKSNPEEMDRLRTQFSLVSKLMHPNISPAIALHTVKEFTYDNEEIAENLHLSDGDVVIIMKYAPGVKLSQWCKQFDDSKVPIDKAIDICQQIASALDYAHSEAIFHRDICPNNIIVETRENGSVIIRVQDFGLTAEIRSSMSRVSMEKGNVVMTRKYMAPEQWIGKGHVAATDQYALACIFYELVTGAVPFADVFGSGDTFIISNCIMNSFPETISDLSEEQNNALMRALDKNPENRFSTCLDFVNSLLNKTEIVNENQYSFAPTNAPTNAVICQNCSYENNASATFCENCGAKIMREDICSKCGNKLLPNQNFCDKCGERVGVSPVVNQPQYNEVEQIVTNFEISSIIVAGIEMVLLPNSFIYMGRFPVTQQQWKDIMGDNPSFNNSGFPNAPVENVSWLDCEKYIQKLNSLEETKNANLVFRLPTSDEWEYACEATVYNNYSMYPNNLFYGNLEMGWFRENSYLVSQYNRGLITHPVGTKQSNPWGLYDMLGNVWEWTCTKHGNFYLRYGGCCRDKSYKCHSKYRGVSMPGNSGPYLGLRLVAFSAL